MASRFEVSVNLNVITRMASIVITSQISIHYVINRNEKDMLNGGFDLCGF